MAKVVFFASVLVSAVLAGAPQAAAGRRPPPNPAISQYVEQVPTSSGAAVPSGHSRAPLPKRVVRELGNGAEGRLLRDAASSAAYGAPQERFRSSKRIAGEARRAVAKPTPALSSGSFSAAAEAIGAKRSVVVWLSFALLLIAAVGVGAAVARARR